MNLYKKVDEEKENLQYRSTLKKTPQLHRQQNYL